MCSLARAQGTNRIIHQGAGGDPCHHQMLTVDIETVPVQDVETELGDTMGLVAQFPVEPLPVQLETGRVRSVGADSINSSGCSTLVGPGERRTWAWAQDRVASWAGHHCIGPLLVNACFSALLVQTGAAPERRGISEQQRTRVGALESDDHCFQPWLCRLSGNPQKWV